MQYQRSPFKIQGNKFALLPPIEKVRKQVAKSIQTEVVWIEPFMGSGTVGFNLANGPARFYDINPYVISFYNDIKSGEIQIESIRETLRREKAKIKDRGSERYYEIRDQFNLTKDPLLFFLLNRLSFNGLIRFNKSGKFNTPYCKDDDKITDSLIESLCNTLVKLKEKMLKWDWQFIVADFKTALEDAKSLQSDTLTPLVFFDPPYIERNPTYFTGWSEDDEKRLFEATESGSFPFIMTTWVHNHRKKHVNRFFDECWSKAFSYVENKHTYIINGTKKNIDSVKIKEAILFRSL